MSSQPRSLQVLLVGCGNIAGGFDSARNAPHMPLTHAGAYQRAGGFELVACIEPDEERRIAFMKYWGISQGYANLESLLTTRSHFDIVSICSPTSLHTRHVEQIWQLNPSLIFCEKPVTPKAADTAALIEATGTRGISLAVNHTRRWAPDVVRLKQELATQRWGRLHSINGSYNKGVLNNGSHMIDLLQFLLGPLQVAWAGAPVADFWPDDPSIPAVLTDQNGVHIHLSTGHAQDYALFELQIATSLGIICMEDGGLNWRFREAASSPHFAGYRQVTAGHRITGEYEQAMLRAVTNIKDHLRDGSPLASTGASALLAQQVCETIQQISGESATQQNPRTL